MLVALSIRMYNDRCCVMYYSYLHSISSGFSEDDGHLRKDDSSCISPTGKVEVRSCLVIGSFVCAFLLLVVWIVCLSIMKCAIDSDTIEG